MIGETVQCQNAGCTEMFVKKAHNQKYHNKECTKIATNAAMMEKYYERRAQIMGKERHCTSCSARLSRYNSDRICNPCKLKHEIEKNQSVLSMLGTISWA